MDTALCLAALEEAIRRMTSLAAQKFQLKGRGLLKEDYAADIVVFDENLRMSKKCYYAVHETDFNENSKQIFKKYNEMSKTIETVSKLKYLLLNLPSITYGVVAWVKYRHRTDQKNVITPKASCAYS